MMTASRPTLPILQFCLSAAVVISVCIALMQSSAFARSPTLGALGVTFDLTVTVSAIYYWLVVRRNVCSKMTLLPVFLVGLTVSSLLFSDVRYSTLEPLWMLAVPLEVVAIVMVLRRVNRLRRQFAEADATESDPLERFEHAARSIYGDNRVIDVIVAEMSVFYYALLSWRTAATVPPGNAAITCYKNSSWTTVLGTLLFLVVLEGTIAHVVIREWSVIAAWCWSVCDVYAMLWLIADYRALVLRPMLVADGHLLVRFGMRWVGMVAFDNVRAAVPFSELKRTPRGKDYLKLTLASDPDLFIVMKEPVEFRGPFGFRKQVRRLAIHTDAPDLLERLQPGAQNVVSSSP